MSKSIRVLGMGVVEAILAALVLIAIGAFAFQDIMEEITTNQQLGHFYKFRTQVASVCDVVKMNPGSYQSSSKEYLVLYPFYDIRFYNKTEDMPDEVKRVCPGDRCACMIKVGDLDFFDIHLCALSDISCIYNKAKLESVLSCFNMQQLGCNNDLWFSKSREEPVRDYNEKVDTTCKLEGVVEWDKTRFNYNKLSKDYCITTGAK